MRLLSAALTDFRNLAAARLELSPSFTALIGPNGQGKTNTLEALYLVSALRPLRNVTRKALIRQGAALAKIALEVEHATTGLTHSLGLELQGAARSLEKDGKKVGTTSFLGMSVAVAFTPDDLQLGKGGPDARRRFLDRALLNVRPAYLERALRYQKAVKDRNRVLQEQGQDALLDAFDAVLAHEGAAILVARARYVAELAPRVQAQFEQIATPAPRLALAYESTLGEALQPEAEDATREALHQRLFERRPADRRRRTTSVGPHLDDLELTLDGVSLRDRASQGQHRAIVLALKLAEITHLAEHLGEPPILLLDDMSSELDALRSRQLFEAVSRLEGQVVLTSTEDPRGLQGFLEAGRDVVTYDVRGGELLRRAG